MKILTTVVILLMFGITGVFSQEAIQVSGSNASGRGGTMSYSVGQMLYKTNTTSIGSIAQGVQQPFEISVIQGKEINIECIAYPNPTSDILKLRVTNFQFRKLYFQLYDITGRLIETKRLLEKETKIMTGQLATATYLLKVTDLNRTIKTFKIIKNH